MIQIRRSEERGHAEHGWLDSRHTFSFADYFDHRHMGFRSLRVINEDWIQPGRGFGAHGHRDMEILTYVLEGSLVHKDSMNHEERLGPDEIQRMSAGTGILHSEYNGSTNEPVHLLQIWIEPAVMGVKPSYEQLRFDSGDKHGHLKLLAGPEGGEGAARINQDASLYVTALAEGQEVRHEMKPGRHAWAQVVRGWAAVNGHALHNGDGAALSEEEAVTIRATGSDAEVLLFDLA